MLNIEHKNLDTVSLLNLEGQVVIGETDHLREIMQSVPPSSSVVLDFSNVTRLDAHGLGVMLQLREEAEARGMNFKLLNVGGRVREILRITRLDSVFQVSSRIGFLPFAAHPHHNRVAA